jgi:hypothetical protein
MSPEKNIKIKKSFIKELAESADDYQKRNGVLCCTKKESDSFFQSILDE